MNHNDELIDELRRRRLELAKATIAMQEAADEHHERKADVGRIRRSIEEILEEIETGRTGRPLIDAANLRPAGPPPEAPSYGKVSEDGWEPVPTAVEERPDGEPSPPHPGPYPPPLPPDQELPAGYRRCTASEWLLAGAARRHGSWLLVPEAPKAPAGEKPYGWEMTLILNNSDRSHYHCVAPTEKAARRKGMLRPRVEGVEDLKPLTREEYVRTYGHGGM